MNTSLSHILRDIAAWRAAKRAAGDEAFAPRQKDYARRAADYAECIKANVRRAIG